MKSVYPEEKFVKSTFTEGGTESILMEVEPGCFEPVSVEQVEAELAYLEWCENLPEIWEDDMREETNLR